MEAIQSAATASLVPTTMSYAEAALAAAHMERGLAETLVFSAKEAIFKAAARHIQRQLRFESAVLRAVHDDVLEFEIASDLGGSVTVHWHLLHRHVLTLCMIRRHMS